MRSKLLLFLLLCAPLVAGLQNLTLSKALKLLDRNNLEIKIAEYESQMKRYDQIAAKGHQLGKLDLTMTGMRSNDPGNVFGFKLQSREATFGDFGFAEFDMTGATNPLPVAPRALNYPDPRNHFLTKLTYQLPIYTGGKLAEYQNITRSLYEISKLDTAKVRNMKIFQVKKAFYDISLVQTYVVNLRKIIRNIEHLRTIVDEMKKEGYAQETDMLEVRARMSEARSMLSQAKLNRTLAYQFLSFLLNTEVNSIRYRSGLAPRPRVTQALINRQNLDIKKAEFGLDITDMAIRLEESNFKPMVGGFAEYGSADDKPLNDFFDKDHYTVGVQVKWNLFNGGTDQANLEKAHVNFMKMSDQVRLARKGIALKAKQLQTEIGGADAQIRSYRTQLKFARKVYEKYQAKYQEGITPISDVLIKQAQELKVLLKLLTVKNKRNSKVFALQSLLNIGAKQ